MRRILRFGLLVVVLVATAWVSARAWEDAKSDPSPDIRSVNADLVVPPLTVGAAAPGKRVRQKVTGDVDSNLSYVLYLPTDYVDGKEYPVIVELAGNGGYRNAFGDVSDGVPEGSKLGYGISAGKQFIWVCVPFVRADGKNIATQWWGDPPTYEVRPTIDYCKSVVADVCSRHGGDRKRVILAGFSRGAIGCNFIGLHDDDVASLWCGFVAFSHYDGVRKWDLPNDNQRSAIARLKRLRGRPQFICEESPTIKRQPLKTQQWIESTGVEGRFTYAYTGFRNHNDAWVLRPSPARKALRVWVQQFAEKP